MGLPLNKLDLRPTDGLRSLACLGVLLTHVVFFLGHAAQDKRALYAMMTEHRWLSFALNFSEPAMDTFLVLTGFLAALTLMPSLEETASYQRTITWYYWKRVVRILPNYYSVLAIVHTLVLPLRHRAALPADARRGFLGHGATFDADVCAAAWPLNFVFLNNQHIGGGCFNITWSLAVQAQFYLLLPLALLALRPRSPGFRKRVALACLATLLAQAAYRAVLATAVRLWEHMPLPLFGPAEAPSAEVMYFVGSHTYLGFVGRLGALSFGVLTAVAACDAATRQALSRHRGKLTAAAAALFALVMIGVSEPKLGIQPDPAHKLATPAALLAGYLGMVGLLQPLLPALAILMLTTGQGGAWPAVGKLLSGPPFAQLAAISYDVYLLHTLVIFGVWCALPPSTWFSPDQPLAVPFTAVTCAVVLFTAAAAWMYHRFWASAVAGLSGGGGAPPGKASQTRVLDVHAKAGQA